VLKVKRVPEFDVWFKKETLKSQRQIQSRLANIEAFEHFGDAKDLGDSLAELRWKSGRRVYFTVSDGKLIILLLGGGKNAQTKDIKKARKLIEKYT